MTAGPSASGTRVGWGFDAHRLDGDPPLRLAGEVVSDSIGVSATSDGDVLAHAVTDALLGACVLGDVGMHFPSDDPNMARVDSMSLLRQAAAMATAAGWIVVHLDVTVIAQEIRIAPHREEMIGHLVEVLAVPSDAVSVKATTTDGLGFIGSGEGLAVVAVITVSGPA